MNSPQSRNGYAKKQAKGEIDIPKLGEDYRRCIRVCNEEDMPQKRPKISEDEKGHQVQSVVPSGINRFYEYVDKLESIFKTSLPAPAPSIPEPPSIVQNVEPQPPLQTTEEIIKQFVIDLDKATKLTPSQLKVLELYKIPYETDPWKFEPRIPNKNQSKTIERVPFENRRSFKKNRPKIFNKVNKRTEEICVEDLIAEIPEEARPKFFTGKYSLKKVKKGFSIRQNIICDRELELIVNN
ncbi:hypothetical protein SteCoe_6264 [Stentor coeruleus]|uniref:Uncharacterized protein n=1 Tax=Stentor coeruleus TaxID=5963 RepID=A0A1R2CQB9_9CILI|nr:hypothetical protein SteCoe_6264 [Stentor coeruleus]